MTFYTAIRTLKAKNWTFVKKYRTYEVWIKGDSILTLPDLPYLPKAVENKIKYSGV
jgi:hypothetical protein